jgi:hypothetical protein
VRGRACDSIATDPRGNLRQIIVNDLPVGRNVDEVLRLVRALQYTDVHGEVCPAGWTPGAATMKDDPKLSKAYFATGATECTYPAATAAVSSRGAGAGIGTATGNSPAAPASAPLPASRSSTSGSRACACL